MKRFAFGLAPVLLAFAALGLMGCPNGPLLAAYPSALDFGAGDTADNLNITNRGAGSLTWSIQDLPSWLTASADTGTITDGLASVTLTADRTGLTGGRHTAEFTVTSSGGSEVIGVSILAGDEEPEEQGLAVSPGGLGFGSQTQTLEVTVTNTGPGSLEWTATPSADWLSVAPSSGTVSAAGAAVEVSVSRDELAAGSYSANLVFTANPDGDEEQSVPVEVTMTVPGTEPVLEVSPQEVDFGVAGVTAALEVANLGEDDLIWSAGESIPWLTVDPPSGTNGGTITLTANRAGLDAGVYSGVVQVTSNGGEVAAAVSLEVAAPGLIVAPAVLDYGEFASLKFASVRNGGSGSIAWQIASDLPSWLTVAPMSGTAEGGEAPEAVQAQVDRSGVAPGDYEHTLTFTWDGEPRTLLVRMSSPLDAVLTAVSEDGNRGPNQPIVSFGANLERRGLDLSNDGDGALTWRIDPEQLPGWLNVNPLSGALQPDESITVYWSADRAGLAAGGYDAAIDVTSNGGAALAYVTMQVPLRKTVITSTEEVRLGTDGKSGAFNVANGGDVGTILDFRVTEEFDWLFVSPETGSSQGASGPIKDWRTVFVSVDRGGINGGTGATGFVVIEAIDEEGEVDPDIEPRQVRVSFEAAPLSFEGARAQTRMPSLVRFVFLMRDVRDEAFAMLPRDVYGNRPPQGAEPFIVFENDVAIESPSETTLTLSTQKNASWQDVLDASAAAPEDQPRIMDLRTRVAILLDYSGSMENAAAGRGYEGIQHVYAAPEGAAGPSAVTEFIGDLFAAFGNAETGFLEVVVMEFHDRSAPPATVIEFTNRPPDVAPLRDLEINDHGASAILPAVESAALALSRRDNPFIPYDSADINAVVLVSDGRLTSPPGLVADTVELMEALGARAFPVGWGDGINHEPMARLAAGTGGHYYPVLGEQTLRGMLAQVATELSSHMVLEYVSLREEENTKVRFSSTLYRDGPSEPAIKGSLASQTLDLLANVGDERMGQISLRSPGIGAPEGDRLYVRLGYAPRNIDYLEFRVSGPGGPLEALQPAPGNDEGAAPGWDLSQALDGTITMQSATGEPLDYGAMGELIRFSLPEGASAPYPVSFEFLTATPSGKAEPSEAKYFISPDYMPIGNEPVQAPAFPTAVFEPETLVFAPGETEQDLVIRNIGGHYTQGGVDIQLYWEIQDTPLSVNVSAEEGAVASAAVPDSLTVSLEAGPRPSGFQGYVAILYDAGDLGMQRSFVIPVFVEP